MKRQLSAPASIQPQKPLELLSNVVWLEGMASDAVDFITSAARIKLFEAGDTITRQGEEVTGIYLIVSGMVKVLATPCMLYQLNFGHVTWISLFSAISVAVKTLSRLKTAHEK